MARSFLLVCFSADAFNFYPVCVAHGVGGGGVVKSARKREARKKKKRRESDGALGQVLIGTIQGESTATAGINYILRHDT